MRPGSLIDEICSNFKERDLAVKRCAIESALEDPTAGRKNAEWVSKHLRSETLLSREELTLYTRLENSGLLHPLLRDPDLGATRPLLEDDIRTAIESLEASTAAVQKQSETLSLQCGTLKKQLQRQESLDQERTRDIARLRKKHEAGRQNTTIVANELSDELDASFRSAMERAGVENKRILSSVSTQLKYDDKALTTLEALVSGVKSSRYDASIIKRTTDLCAMLADYSAEEIHCRLDRTYLETIQAETSNDDSAAAKAETIAALREELESLYPEIEVLAELSTQKQFHEPILREIHNGHGQLRTASQQKLEQALDVLIDMTLNKQTYTKQLEDRESSCELLERLASLCQAEVGIDSVSQPPSRRESLRRRSMQPGTLLAASRKVAPLPEQPALESFLRRIGVNPESALRPRVEFGDAHELHEKRIHISETVRSLGVAVGWPLVTQMAPSNSASQLLASALYANSYFDTSLRDPNQEEALSALETELASLQKGMQGIKLDILHQRDKCRERFLERWSQSQHSDSAR